MFRRLLIATLLLASICLEANHCWAQKKWEDPKWDKWKVALSPYLWYVGFNGTISRTPVPAQGIEPENRDGEIDVGFKDIRGALKFALMLTAEYQGDKALVLFNITSFIIQGEAFSPGFCLGGS